MQRLWIAFISLSLFAQEAPVLQQRPAVLPLSLKRAVEIALAPEGNARVQIADEFIHQAKARAAEARSALLPNFDASVSEQNQVRNLRALGIDFPIPIPGFNFPSVVGPFNVFDVRVSGSAERVRLQLDSPLPGCEDRGGSDQGRCAGDSEPGGRPGGARLSGRAPNAEASLETGRANLDLSKRW